MDEHIDHELYKAWKQGDFNDIDDMLDALSCRNARMIFDAESDDGVPYCTNYLINGHQFCIVAMQYVSDCLIRTKRPWTSVLPDVKNIIMYIRLLLVQHNLAGESLLHTSDFEHAEQGIQHLSFKSRMFLNPIIKEIRRRSKLLNK